jgi:hypothetical protein
MRCAGSWRIAVADVPNKRGIHHAYSLDQLREFRAIPAEEKLRWLEAMRGFLERALTPEKLEIMKRFRRGDL